MSLADKYDRFFIKWYHRLSIVDSRWYCLMISLVIITRQPYQNTSFNYPIKSKYYI